MAAPSEYVSVIAAPRQSPTSVRSTSRVSHPCASAIAAQSGPPTSNPIRSSRAAGISRARRAATLAEAVAAMAPIDTMVPAVAATFSRPGMFATSSGIKSDRPRSRNCAMKSSPTTVGKYGYWNTPRSGSPGAGPRGVPGAPGATSSKSTISPSSATAQSPAVAKKA